MGTTLLLRTWACLRYNFWYKLEFLLSRLPQWRLGQSLSTGHGVHISHFSNGRTPKWTCFHGDLTYAPHNQNHRRCVRPTRHQKPITNNWKPIISSEANSNQEPEPKLNQQRKIVEKKRKHLWNHYFIYYSHILFSDLLCNQLFQGPKDSITRSNSKNSHLLDSAQKVS